MLEWVVSWGRGLGWRGRGKTEWGGWREKREEGIGSGVGGCVEDEERRGGKERGWGGGGGEVKDGDEEEGEGGKGWG